MDGSRKTEAASPNCRETASEELLGVIKKLRSDGIQSPDLRLPEPLLKVLKLEPDSPFARHHVSKALLSYVACLEEDARSAFLFSAGLSKDTIGSPGGRVNRPTTVLKMGRRTLYRHIEKAAHEITHLLLVGDHTPALENIDFVTTRTHCRLDLRDDSPTILMDRTVMASRDGFNVLDEHLFPPLSCDELRYYALEGYRLAGVQGTGGSWIIQLRLPRCLNVGRSHAFSVSVRLPDHDCLEPVLGLAPVTSMHVARIKLHFEARFPSFVEHIDHAWPYQLISPTAFGHPIDVMDKRVVADFGNIQPGWGYGVRWTWWAPAHPAGSLSTHTTPAVHSRA